MSKQTVSTGVGAAGRIAKSILSLDLGKVSSWVKVAGGCLLVLTALWCLPELTDFLLWLIPRLLMANRGYCEGPPPAEPTGLDWVLGVLVLVAGLAILAAAVWILWRERPDAEWWCDMLAATAFALGALVFGVRLYLLEAGHATGPGWTRLGDLLLDIAATITPLAWFSGVGLCCLLGLMVCRSRRAVIMLLVLFALPWIGPPIMDQLAEAQAQAEWAREARARQLLLAPWEQGAVASYSYPSFYSGPDPPLLSRLHAGSSFSALVPLSVLMVMLGKGVSRRRQRQPQGDLVWWAQRTACASLAGAVFLIAAVSVVRDDFVSLACETSGFLGNRLPLALSFMLTPSLCFLAVAALGFLVALALKAMASPTNSDSSPELSGCAEGGAS